MAATYFVDRYHWQSCFQWCVVSCKCTVVLRKYVRILLRRFATALSESDYMHQNLMEQKCRFVLKLCGIVCFAWYCGRESLHNCGLQWRLYLNLYSLNWHELFGFITVWLLFWCFLCYIYYAHICCLFKATYLFVFIFAKERWFKAHSFCWLNECCVSPSKKSSATHTPFL